MKKLINLKSTFILLFILASGMCNAQVGIGTTSPADGALLDLNSTNKGLLVPRVNISDLTTITPVTPGTASGTDGLLVWNTNSTTGVGFHYWDGNDWIPLTTTPSDDWTILGNSITAAQGGTTTTDGTAFIGTTNNRNLNFRTNGIFRGRMSNLGEFFIGTQNTVIPGDLMNAVGNITFPWAVNGYTDFDGAGVYGSVTSGTTGFAAVQGEYVGTNTVGPGVRGITYTTTAGSDFDGDTVRGVHGTLSTGNLSHSFGVLGDIGGFPNYNFNIRTGGVLGTDLFARGALGYYAANGNDYSVYGFGTARVNGIATGRLTESNGLDTHIGLGIHGGFMGGWIKGHEYGAILSGDRFGSYTNGKSITNDTFIVLDEKPNGDKQATYASTSMSIDVQSKGMSNLVNGTARVDFDKSFSSIIDEKKPIFVSITPYGESNGVYIVSVDKNGFVIKENNDGQSNVQFNWIAIGEKYNKNPYIADEIVSKDFDNHLNLLMHNDELDGGQSMWMENGKLKTGQMAPINPKKIEKAKTIQQASRINPKKE